MVLFLVGSGYRGSSLGIFENYVLTTPILLVCMLSFAFNRQIQFDTNFFLVCNRPDCTVVGATFWNYMV
jgi:hypothetical protein